MGVERRGRVVRGCVRSINQKFSGRSRVDELKSPGKPFGISKRAVWEAWEKVRANKGAPGVDGESIAGFEKDLKGSLYKIWNRMSSGTYFPPPVRAVEIAKAHGTGTRMLGVPTEAA
jgi:RNA-directed DNA polymerase